MFWVWAYSASCEDFLSEKKYDFIDEADFYTNNTELELAVNGAYEVLSEKMTYGHFYARQRLRYRPEAISRVRVQDKLHETLATIISMPHIPGWKNHGGFIIQVLTV